MTPGHQEGHDQGREEGNQLQYGEAMSIVDRHCEMELVFVARLFFVKFLLIDRETAEIHSIYPWSIAMHRRLRAIPDMVNSAIWGQCTGLPPEAAKLMVNIFRDQDKSLMRISE